MHDKDGVKQRFTVELKGEPPKLYIRDGDFYTWTNTELIEGADLPINDKWLQEETADLLISCTQSAFKVYLNGKHLKTWTTKHNPADGTFPKLNRVDLTYASSRLTAVSWTYGNKMYNTALLYCFMGQ